MKKLIPLILAAALTLAACASAPGHSVHPSRKLDLGTDRSNYPCPNHSPLLPGGQLVQQWRHLLCLCPPRRGQSAAKNRLCRSYANRQLRGSRLCP